MFFDILQNLQANTYARDSFLIKLQAFPALILGKRPWLCQSLGQVFHLKCSFKYLGEKTLNFFPAGSFFMTLKKCLSSTLIPRWKCLNSQKPPLPRKISGSAPVWIRKRFRKETINDSFRCHNMWLMVSSYFAVWTFI